MTIDIRVDSASDLSVDNEVMYLSRAHLPPGKTLAGASWLVTFRPKHEALLAVLRLLFDLIKKRFPSYDVWFLIGDSALQPDNRISRYYRLWKSLRRGEIEISHASCTQEVMRELEGGLKFFGAKKISELSIESVVNALLQERGTYLIALPNSSRPKEIQEILGCGWSGFIERDQAVVARLFENHGLLLVRVGDFDDPERGVVVTCTPESSSI